MFNNIVFEKKDKKVIHWEGARGNGGTVLITSWKCDFSIYLDIQVYYLDIQAITSLLCLLLVLYVLFPSIHSLWSAILNCYPEQWCFPALKSLLPPQFSTYRYRTGFIVKRKQVRITNYLGLPLYWFKKNCLFCPKNTYFSKNCIKFIIRFFSKSDNWAYVYMY